MTASLHQNLSSQIIHYFDGSVVANIATSANPLDNSSTSLPGCRKRFSLDDASKQYGRATSKRDYTTGGRCPRFSSCQQISLSHLTMQQRSASPTRPDFPCKFSLLPFGLRWLQNLEMPDLMSDSRVRGRRFCLQWGRQVAECWGTRMELPQNTHHGTERSIEGEGYDTVFQLCHTPALWAGRAIMWGRLGKP